jgi:hypothetical protein
VSNLDRQRNLLSTSAQFGISKYNGGLIDLKLSLRGGSIQPQPEVDNNEESDESPEEQLVWFARTGEAEEIRRLLDTGGVNVNWADPRAGNTALHMAAANGHTACIDMLLRAGADAGAANARGNTALHWAAENRRTDAARRLLEEAGADVLRRNGFGKGALTLAFQTGEEDLVGMVRRRRWRRSGGRALAHRGGGGAPRRPSRNVHRHRRAFLPHPRARSARRHPRTLPGTARG